MSSAALIVLAAQLRRWAEQEAERRLFEQRLADAAVPVLMIAKEE